jgi:hypothetical protein
MINDVDKVCRHRLPDVSSSKFGDNVREHVENIMSSKRGKDTIHVIVVSCCLRLQDVSENICHHGHGALNTIFVGDFNRNRRVIAMFNRIDRGIDSLSTVDQRLGSKIWGLV